MKSTLSNLLLFAIGFVKSIGEREKRALKKSLGIPSEKRGSELWQGALELVQESISDTYPEVCEQDVIEEIEQRTRELTEFLGSRDWRKIGTNLLVSRHRDITIFWITEPYNRTLEKHTKIIVNSDGLFKIMEVDQAGYKRWVEPLSPREAVRTILCCPQNEIVIHEGDVVRRIRGELDTLAHYVFEMHGLE